MATSEQLPEVVFDQGGKATSRATRATSQTGSAADAAAGFAVSGREAAINTFVIDTSVLLSDPRALLRFAEHEVIVPIVVITELESKRHDPELGYFARKALRLLDDLRVKHGGLNQPIPIGDDGGSLMVELNHISSEVLPLGFRSGDNDSRILAVAKNLANEGRNVTVVSKDLPMRVK
ncbi:MAG: PIN domain-containing protein, partial [Pseudarthrobacter sp.]